MNKFKTIIEKEKQHLFLNEDNIIHKFFNYILNDITNEYKISYIFYNLSNSKKNFEEKCILQLSLIINIYSTLIDIIYNLPFFLDIKVTNNIISIHEVFNETITILGIMFSINYLMSLHLKVLNKLKIDKTNIINKILPFMNEDFEWLNNTINDKDINIIFGGEKENKKIVLERKKKERQIKFIRIILKYLELMDNRITFTEENVSLLYFELQNKDVDINKLKNMFNLY